MELSLNAEKTEIPLRKRLENFDGTDKGLYELIFNFGRYLVIASSRQGTQATNLQGIWNEEWVPAWSSNYTLNINTQMNYWPVLSCNLKECFMPLIDLVSKISLTGKEIAKEFYNAEGFVCHHSTDIWGHANPVGQNERGNSVYTCWNMASGWLACQMFDYYEYTEDEKLLCDKLLPIMIEAAKFYLDIMEVDEDGYYIITPSTSPENFFMVDGENYAVAKTTTMTMSIVRELFLRVIKACDILEVEDEILYKIHNVLPKLFPLQISKGGGMMEWDADYEEFDEHHRHISHLYSLFPGDGINTEEFFEACRKTLNNRGMGGTGWSIGWKLNAWATLKDGEKALQVLKRQLHLVEATKEIDYQNGGGTYPNLFDAHPPFQIDGNFGVVAGIANMLVQSRNGVIDILPALPKSWNRGYVKGLKVKGDIEVIIKWEDNCPVEVILTSKRDREVSIRMNDGDMTVKLKANVPLAVNRIQKDIARAFF